MMYLTLFIQVFFIKYQLSNEKAGIGNNRFSLITKSKWICFYRDKIFCGIIFIF